VKDCFLVDTKHGLALLPSDEEETSQRVARIQKKLDKSERGMVMMVKVGQDVDESEAEYMRTTCLLPRRVLMRLRKK
jgi:hypothetical protein